ncbi:hypothetical protein QMZ92_28915 [Streptomyces sp. HNM0645]|uniref:hypothetical protein n=1 Tax=Streptomyces sp. HNM0645 TaxID=2782343 RepID=UPI0024B7E649|nr:hypothetical protein [Streptomyces sp. HNM0645]MDI9888284.1 hypothetical protein [Streptomyces sp. HNM0645]
MSLAKRPIRATRTGLVAGLATVTLVTTGGAAAAAPVPAAAGVPVTTTTDSTGLTVAVRSGTGLAHLPEDPIPAERPVAEILCSHLEHAVCHGAVPEEALAFCKHVNGWD